MDDLKFNVSNDINIVIKTKEKGVLLDDDCCTCINILLTNEGKIATSFLGTHNPFIVNQLEKAQKEYFKVLKKTLKKDFKEYATAPGFEDDGCDNDNCTCHDHDKDEPCSCGHENCNCNETNSNEKQNTCNCETNEHKNQKETNSCKCDTKEHKHQKETKCTCNDKKNKK